MSFKRRHGREAEGGTGSHFQHASGYSDLAGLLGEHTLKAEQETAAATAPKGYRARSIGKIEPRSHA